MKKQSEKDAIHKIRNFFERNDKIINGICSIISAFIIGIFTIVSTNRSLDLANMQAQYVSDEIEILKREKGAFIDAQIEYNGNDDGIAYVSIRNKGESLEDSNIEIATYFNVRSEENFDGGVPLRIYVRSQQIESDTEVLEREENEIEVIKIYTEKTPLIHKIEREFIDACNGKCGAFFQTAIKIMTKNMLGETEYKYYKIYNQRNNSLSSVSEYSVDFIDKPIISKIDSTVGEEIFSDPVYADDIYLKNGVVHYNMCFLLEDYTGEQLFRQAIYRLRENNLYVTEAGKVRLYEGYEPTEIRNNS